MHCKGILPRVVPFARQEHSTAPMASRSLSVLMVGLEWFGDNPGGAGRYMADAALGLAARGHRVAVVVPRLTDASADVEEIDGVEVCRFRTASGPAKLWSAMAAIDPLIERHGLFDV